MILLQLSSSQGPAECELAVAKALGQIMREAKARDISVEVVEHLSGSHAGTYRSLLLALEGEQAEALAQRWSGTLKWVCQIQLSRPHRWQRQKNCQSFRGLVLSLMMGIL